MFCLSELWHKSLSAQDYTVKVALFHEGNPKLRTDMKNKKAIFDAYLDNKEDTIEGSATFAQA